MLRLIICNVDTFPLISPSDIVNLNELTVMLKIIGQCDIKHIMTLTMKNNNVSVEGFDNHNH